MIKFIKQNWFAFVIPIYFMSPLFTSISELFRNYKYNEVILRISPSILISLISFIVIYRMISISSNKNTYINIFVGIVYQLFIIFGVIIPTLPSDFKYYVCQQENPYLSILFYNGVIHPILITPLFFPIKNIFIGTIKYKLLLLIILIIPLIIGYMILVSHLLKVIDGNCFIGI